MKVTLPEKVTGARDALFVLEVEFPVATAERTVEVNVTGPVEPLDLSGSSRGGTYRIPVGLERLHVPMRVLEDGDGEALINVTCLEGPEATLNDHQMLRLEAPGASGKGGGSKRLLLGAAALAAVALLAFFLAKRGGDDVVPDVRGQEEATARVALKEAGYVVRPTYDREVDQAQDGLVIRQMPAAGSATPADRIVELVIGRPPEELARVPAVGGEVVDNAERTLEALGYQVIVTEQDNDDPQMTGRVLSQLPEGGEALEAGGQVEIVVARAPVFVLLPDLVGQTREEAERRVSELGLVADVSVEDTDEIRHDGMVLRQAPLPGSQLDVGALVAVVVGRAAAADVPEDEWSDPAGTSMDTAAGPDPLPAVPGPADPVPSDPVPADPVPAGPVARPTTPAVAIERGEDGQLTIPDFSGWTREDAVDRLREAGLQPIVTLTPASTPEDQGRVIRQRPAPGVKRQGGMVFLTVGEGAAEPSVPVEVPVDVPVDVPVAGPLDAPDDAPEDPLAPGAATGPAVAELPRPEEGSEADVLDDMIDAAAATAGTPVPDVVGLQQEDAESLLVDLGLIVQVVPQPTDYPPPGTVLGQDPAPGEPRPRGAQVRLEVAAAPGSTPAVATTAPGTEEPAPPVPGPVAAPPTGPQPMPEGVTRLSASSGVGRGPIPPVRLPARDAAKTATVPPVENLTVQDAVIRVLQAGLIPIIEMDRSPETTEGRVAGQTPSGAAPALLGDLVRLRVGAPPRTAERMVDLPTVIGADLDSARRIFAATRTGLEIFEIRVPSHPYAGTGRVAAQYPVSAMPRAQAGRVTLFIVGR